MDIDQAARCQCLDINKLTWSEEISHVLDVDLNTILPQPKAVDEIIGYITDNAAKQTGLISGIPVVAGCSDAMASMYATGLSKIGEAGESSGTTSRVFVGHNKQSASNLPVVTKPCSIEGMPYLFDAPISTSGASIKWFLDNLGNEEITYASNNNINVYEHINELALKVNPGSNGVIYFPYLLGERAPLWNSYAKGMFIGLSLGTTRNDIIRSVFEGTAYALRHVITIIKDAGASVNCLRITGGGAKSHTWSQIKASMLRIPVLILDDKSGDVPFGDTLIAGHAVGVFPDLTESINRLIQVKEIIQPVDQWADAYDKLYPYYIDMYQDLDKDLFRYQKTLSNL